MTISGSVLRRLGPASLGRLASSAAVGSRVGEPLPAVDLWAPVPFDDLPVSLVRAAARSDWKTVRDELRTVMDGVATDGAYGRAFLQLVMSLPLPSHPVLA